MRLSKITPIACLLLAACGDDLSPPSVTPPPSAVYAPSQGMVPLPTDLLFSGTTDLTIQIPGVDDGSNPNATPVEVALSAMTGWSTTAPLTVQFSSAIDATTLVAGTTFRMFEVTLDTSTVPVGGPVNGVVAELAAGTDYSVGLAPEITAGTAIRVYFERPLKPGTSYMWVFTNGLTTVDGTPFERTGEYLIASSPDLFDPGAPIFPLQVTVNAHLAAAASQGVVAADVVLSNSFTTTATTNVIDAITAIVGGQEATLISGLCSALPSMCAGEDTSVDMNNTSALVMNQTSTIDTADRVVGSPGLADIYTGELTLPYYLTAATNPSDTAPVVDPTPLGAPIKARFPFNVGSTTKHLTPLNSVPASTGQEVIPVLVCVPNATSGQMKPAGGWPVVLFQHGITRNRLDMLLVADNFAAQGIAMVAIDLPLHGSSDISDTVLFAGFDALAGGARERTFGLDLVNLQGAPGPDGAVDASGAHFINLGNLLVAQSNLVQAVSDLLHLNSHLGTLDYDGGGADFDPARVHFVGHSLGAMVGVPFLRAAATSFQSASLGMAGGGIAKLLDGSPSFGPAVEAGLASAGVLPGTADYESFLWGAQTVLDPVDPINYASDLGLTGLPMHFIEIVGGGMNLPDQTVPNTVPLAPLSGSRPLVTQLGLTTIIADTVDGGGIQGHVRFTEGEHSSLINPLAGAAVYGEINAQMVEFVLTSGTNLTLVDETIIDTTP